nr:hypothetical protein [uncultured Bacillus sp.]
MNNLTQNDILHIFTTIQETADQYGLEAEEIKEQIASLNKIEAEANERI